MISIGLNNSKASDFSLSGFQNSERGFHFSEYNEAERQKLTKMIMKLFDRWGLSTADQLEVLGLSANSRRMLSKYRSGSALPSNRDMLDRLGWLLVIHQNLRTLYPANPDLRYSWVNQRNPYFDHRTPIEVMKSEGLLGIHKVAQLLEHVVEL